MFRFVRDGVAPALGVVLIAGALAGCSQPEAPAGQPKITVAITPVSTSACVQVTQERGAFEDAGVDVELVPAPPTSAAQIAQLVNGQITVGLGAYTGVIAAVATGIPVTITNASDYAYDLGPGQTSSAVLVLDGSPIESFSDLEGKVVAVNSLQGTWELAIREAIERDGGDPSKVELTTVSFSDQGAALKAERVDAILSPQPLVSALTAEGIRSIGDPFPVALDTEAPANAVMFMSKEFVADNAAAAKTFVETMVEGDAWCNAHHDEMLEAISRITEIPAEALAKAPLPVFGAEIDPAETETWITLLKKYGVIEVAPSVEDVQWADAPAK
jgi:NitT/TauT family transport system substrate-binding protein